MTPIPLWVYLGIVACSGISCALSVPFWRRWCVRIGLIDEPGGRKDHSQITPLAGGLAVFSGLAISVLIGVLGIELGWISPEMLERFRYGLAKRAIPLSAILFGALGILILGLVDDRFELSPKFKFLGQFTVATLIAVAGIRITLFVPSAVFSYVVTVFWIVTLMNSVNFLDNMNGLTGGLAVIASAGFAIIAIQHQQYLVAMMGCMIVGSFLGFLPFNFPRASIFLGDAGSHLAGFLVAVLAILPHFFNVNSRHRSTVLVPLIILCVPLVDLIQVVIVRTLHRKPFWMGDHNHLSHRLLGIGLSRTQSVLSLWFMAGIASVLGVWLATHR